jgi:hypothetical protein
VASQPVVIPTGERDLFLLRRQEATCRYQFGTMDDDGTATSARNRVKSLIRKLLAHCYGENCPGKTLLELEMLP